MHKIYRISTGQYKAVVQDFLSTLPAQLNAFHLPYPVQEGVTPFQDGRKAGDGTGIYFTSILSAQRAIE